MYLITFVLEKSLIGTNLGSNYGLLILYMVCHLDFIEDFD